jgi:7-alpha-hydroxysteroid dehydrogenase
MILDRFRLDNRVAIVTGAGRGLGAAIALGFAEAGADVVIAARTESDLTAVAEQIRQEGRRAHIGLRRPRRDCVGGVRAA